MLQIYLKYEKPDKLETSQKTVIQQKKKYLSTFLSLISDAEVQDHQCHPLKSS